MEWHLGVTYLQRPSTLLSSSPFSIPFLSFSPSLLPFLHLLSVLLPPVTFPSFLSCPSPLLSSLPSSYCWHLLSFCPHLLHIRIWRNPCCRMFWSALLKVMCVTGARCSLPLRLKAPFTLPFAVVFSDGCHRGDEPRALLWQEGGSVNVAVAMTLGAVPFLSAKIS